MKIDLPDGEWADLREAAKVPERLRRPVVAAQADIAGFASDPDTKMDAARFDALSALSDVVIVALVREWSFGVPVATESLLDLPGDAYDALRQAVMPHAAELLPDFGPAPGADTPTPA